MSHWRPRRPAETGDQAGAEWAELRHPLAQFCDHLPACHRHLSSLSRVTCRSPDTQWLLRMVHVSHVWPEHSHNLLWVSSSYWEHWWPLIENLQITPPLLPVRILNLLWFKGNFKHFLHFALCVQVCMHINPRLVYELRYLNWNWISKKVRRLRIVSQIEDRNENPFPEQNKTERPFSFFSIWLMFLIWWGKHNWIWELCSLALFVKKDWGQSLFSRFLAWNHEVEIIFCHLAKIGRGDKIGRDWETRVQIHFVVKWQPLFVNWYDLTWQSQWSVAFLNSLVELQKTWPISLKWLLSKAILR